MIRLVQFCTLVVFASMLQCYITEASDLHHPLRNGADFFAHSETSAIQILEHLWYDNIEPACGVDPDQNNIPSIKSLLRFTGTRRKYRSPHDPLPDTGQSQLPSSHSSDPVRYYVFGLKKIIT